MATIDLRKTVLPLGAVVVSLVTLAAGTSAQSRVTPERPLSDAMAEVLRGPFHGDRAPSGSPGLVLPPGPVGAAASPAQQPPGARIPAAAGAPSAEDDTPSLGKVFAFTALASAAGVVGSHYLAMRCTSVEPLFSGGPAAPLANPGAGTDGDALCPTDNEAALALTGILATVTMTGGAATLAGRRFWDSLVASAMGYAVGVAAGIGLSLAADDSGWESPLNAILGGALILSHAAITTLFSAD